MPLYPYLLTEVLMEELFTTQLIRQTIPIISDSINEIIGYTQQSRVLLKLF